MALNRDKKGLKANSPWGTVITSKRLKRAWAKPYSYRGQPRRIDKNAPEAFNYSLAQDRARSGVGDLQKWLDLIFPGVKANSPERKKALKLIDEIEERFSPARRVKYDDHWLMFSFDNKSYIWYKQNGAQTVFSWEYTTRASAEIAYNSNSIRWKHSFIHN